MANRKTNLAGCEAGTAVQNLKLEIWIWVFSEFEKQLDAGSSLTSSHRFVATTDIFEYEKINIISSKSFPLSLLFFTFHTRLHQMNETFQQPGRWHDVILTPAQRQPTEPLSHVMSFTLRGLQAGSVYEAIVQAKNRYGWNEVSILALHYHQQI